MLFFDLNACTEMVPTLLCSIRREFQNCPLYIAGMPSEIKQRVRSPDRLFCNGVSDVIRMLMWVVCKNHPLRSNEEATNTCMGQHPTIHL